MFSGIKVRTELCAKLMGSTNEKSFIIWFFFLWLEVWYLLLLLFGLEVSASGEQGLSILNSVLRGDSWHCSGNQKVSMIEPGPPVYEARTLSLNLSELIWFKLWCPNWCPEAPCGELQTVTTQFEYNYFYGLWFLRKERMWANPPKKIITSGWFCNTDILLSPALWQRNPMIRTKPYAQLWAQFWVHGSTVQQFDMPRKIA